MSNSVSNKNPRCSHNLKNFETDNLINRKRHCQMLAETVEEYLQEDYFELLWIKSSFILLES